jgi:hypothetical protein
VVDATTKVVGTRGDMRIGDRWELSFGADGSVWTTPRSR